MKLVNMAWVLGGMTALSLGMAAEACSSSSTPSNSGQTADCTTLSACCPFLGTQESSCQAAVTSNNCTAYLTSAQTTCTNAMKAGSSGTGGTPSSGIGATSGTGTTPPSSGTGTTPPSSGSGTTPPSSGTGTTGGSGSGSCYNPPGTLYAETPDGGGFYCPFSKPDVDGGKTKYCTGGTEQCCEPASGTSTCSTSACATGDTSWGCEGAPDCSGMTCCAIAATGKTLSVATNPACGANAAFPYFDGFGGTACSATCASGFQICSTTSECPTGQTCTPIEPKGNTVGYCAQ